MALELIRADGKVAMITGGGRGIGKVAAHVMAEAGAKVAICARSQDQLDETVREVEQMGGQAFAVRADVTKPADLQVFVDRTLDRFGKIDYLVNNAGGNEVIKSFLDWSNEEMIDTFRLNVSSAYVLSQIVGPHMVKAGKGSIVNISSEGGKNLSRGFLPYAVSKAALNHFTILLAQEFAPKIRVNALSLGPIMTPLSEQVRDQNPEAWAGVLKTVPLNIGGDPRCVALSILFLCSEASSFITGVVLPVAGGCPGPVTTFGIPDL